MLHETRKAVSLIYNLFYQGVLDQYYLGDLDYSSKAAYERAATMNCDVVIPTNQQLQVDIDNDLQYAIFQKNLSALKTFYRVYNVLETTSKSGGDKKHITIDLCSPVENTERLVLQAFLGSDLKREFLSMLRIKDNDPIPTLFFEKKPEVVKPIDYEDDIPF